MKKIMMILAAILTLTTAVALTGCGSDKSADSKADKSDSTAAAVQTEAQTEAAAASGSLTAGDLVFTYNGASVELNSDADAAVASLGEANDVSSQLSCHGEGEDKTYTYNGFVLNTYPLDGQDRVLEVVINTAGIPTSKGVQVGDPVSAVTAAYGDNYKSIGMYYAYEGDDGKSLQFFIQNDAVQEISYYYDV